MPCMEEISRRASGPSQSSAPSPGRVFPGYRDLVLNPLVVYVSALPMLHAPYSPVPDKELKAIGRECVAIRDVWNASVVREDAIWPYYGSRR